MPLWAFSSAIWVSSPVATAFVVEVASFLRAQAVELAPEGIGQVADPRVVGFLAPHTHQVDGPRHLHGAPTVRTFTVQVAAEDAPGFEQAVDPLGHPPEVADGTAGTVEEGSDERVDAYATLLVEDVNGVADPLGDRGVLALRLTLGGAFGADRERGDLADQHRAEDRLRLQLVAEGLDADLNFGLIPLQQDDALAGESMLE